MSDLSGKADTRPPALGYRADQAIEQPCKMMLTGKAILVPQGGMCMGHRAFDGAHGFA